MSPAFKVVDSRKENGKALAVAVHVDDVQHRKYHVRGLYETERRAQSLLT